MATAYFAAPPAAVDVIWKYDKDYRYAEDTYLLTIQGIGVAPVRSIPIGLKQPRRSARCRLFVRVRLQMQCRHICSVVDPF